MSLERFLTSLEMEGGKESEGEFTLAAERARRLLAERVLDDQWNAWSCLIQGFHRLGALSLSLSLNRSEVALQACFDQPPSLGALLRDDRLLLGWLNLDWFGSPQWDESGSRIVVRLSGSVLKRYRLLSALGKHLTKALALAPIPVTLDGKPLKRGQLPNSSHYTLYRCRPTIQALKLQSNLGSLSPDRFKIYEWEEESPGPIREWAAVAYRSRNSWSHAVWVSEGVVIKEERNTLERPGLAVVASVESLGLNTDLSGFGVVHDEAYFRFVNRLKKQVLWML